MINVYSEYIAIDVDLYLETRPLTVNFSVLIMMKGSLSHVNVNFTMHNLEPHL